MSWIRGMLSGLLSAVEGMVDAINGEDHVNTIMYMKQSNALMDHIDAQWAEMVGALEGYCAQTEERGKLKAVTVEYDISDWYQLITPLEMDAFHAAQAVLAKVKEDA